MIGKAQVLGLGAWAAALTLFAACGSSVVGATGSGTTGNGAGGSGTTGSGLGGDGCSNLEECSGGATTGPGGFGTGGLGGGGGPFGDGGSGPGSPCGGFVGAPCGLSEYCAFSDQECGGNDGVGACTSRPTACNQIFQPTCGCDHMVYGNPCEAAQAGVDVDDLGGCTAPPGMFGCGSGFCELAAQYCMQVPSGVESGLTTYTCEPLPAACGSAPACACLSQVTCGANCGSTPDGGLEVTCETN